MMLILLVVLWLLGVLARDAPRKETKYVIKQIKSCPEVGYYFRRETSRNALDANVCYLCFCQDDGTAICWQRENKRCDATHYQHVVGKRDTRVRRSPIGLSDIFFRDAARDMFNKQMPETCKPYESSFSEGCPPADWCVGCTVCDCDAHGRWDCHILSFCPDKKDKTKMKRSKKRLRDGPPKRTTIDINVGAPPTLTTKNHPKRTPGQKNTTVRTSKQINLRAKNVTRVNSSNKHIKQIKNVKQKSSNTTQLKRYTSPKPVTINNNTARTRRHTSPKPLIIKKDTIPKTPMIVKSKPNLNKTDVITQEVFKKVVSAMQTFLEKKLSAVRAKPTIKTVQKRTMVKRSTSNIKNTKNAKKKVNGKFKPVADKKKYTKPVGPKNNKQKNAKKPVKAARKGVTTRKPNNKVAKANGKRIKRDVSDYDVTETVVIENSSYINTVPMPILSNSTLAQKYTITNGTGTNNYYKYSMITPTLSIATENPQDFQIVYALAKNKTKNNTSHMLKKRDKEKHFDEIQAMLLNSSVPDINNNTFLDNQKYVVKSVPDFNDLKFNNWPQIKLLKNSLIIKKLVHVNNSTKNYKYASNLTEKNQEITMKKHLKAKDIARVLSSPLRKYNRSKIINTLSCNNNSVKGNRGNYREQIYHKIDDLQNVLKRVLGEFRKNNTTKTKRKPIRFNVIKYLKKFFGKLFRRYNSKGINSVKEQIELNNHIIDSICESFSNCDMSQKNNVILRSKLQQLNSESYTIIKTIKIIKGLLHLLDIPTNTNLLDMHKLKPLKNNFNLKDDIHKLNAVLRDKYTNSNTPLTSTQITQIRYIKNNTQLFVQTVGRFANILNEIITILTKKHNIKDKSKLSVKTAKRSYENNRKLKNDTTGDFKQLKGLLIKYNLIQNTFVRKMYKLLSKFEKVREDDTTTKVSNETRVSRATIENFSKNIITNLRKLKNLANMLNSRRKRDTVRDDDAMEYLLTLMEYLIKQNYPLDVAPVNDGIDLLIEAIKSAPDIKPIKKKVLQSMPVNIRISRTTEPVPINMLKVDSLSDSRRVSEDVSYNDTKSDTRSETGEQSSYQEMEKEDNFKYPPVKNIFETEDDTNTKVNYEKGETLIPSNQIDTITTPGAYSVFVNVEKTTEHNNFKKFEQFTLEKSKKYEVFDSDFEDDDIEVNNSSSSTVAADLEIEKDRTETLTVPLETTTPILADGKSKQYAVNSVDVSGSSDGEKRVGLDWLDEGYEDSKEIRQTKGETTTVLTTEPVITTEKPSQVDVSTLTKEVTDEIEKRKPKINIEDVMFKKQMDLLNSLDYGTERSETDEQESKEGDERYSGDAFPAYFV